ncbi:glycoside hydrolase family 43 protein [Microthyrium microscopicum]|uniref:Glycoside hydrolase family 43 protein n=1 Tax=Microthyrium microscopicum TaxID=703497 RepID=A0A6A6UQE2_9PEZI|nr:glycoside hydrolase family 43 protein [Microthyrium microscopicum]
MISLFRLSAALSYILPLAVSLVKSPPDLVISQDFPDPSVINVDGVWYAFATQNNLYHIQIARSDDWNNWSVLDKDALGSLPSWVDQNTPAVWAPDIIERPDGTFVLYFSATVSGTSHHCVGVATSKEIEGPYQADARPLACPDPLGSGRSINPSPYFTSPGRGGAIDASGFKDVNGSLFVLFKVDGNSLGIADGQCNNGGDESQKVPTPIMVVPVQDDGFTPKSSAIQILDRGPEDGPLIEAPSLYITSDGSYNLLYSSNCYLSASYSIKFASASSVTGSYTKIGNLASTNSSIGLIAPGGADAAADNQHVVFHGNLPQGGRGMYATTITRSQKGTSFG